MKIHNAWLVVALSVPATLVLGQDQPVLQEGLWEIHTHDVQNPDGSTTDSTVKVCRDRAYDKLIEDLTKYRTGCTSTSSDAGPGTIKVLSRCNMGGSVVATEGTFTVQSASAHAETHRTFSPAWGGVSDEVQTQDQTYLGKCPANFKSGGIVSAAKTTSP